MDEYLKKFNECFPDSKYREVNRYYSGDDHSIYQRSKAPINTKILSFDEIKNTENRIGWIIPRDYIAIDLDDKLEASKLYNVLTFFKVNFIWMVGKHGGHFIFKNPRNYSTGTKFATAIGLTIDTRSQEKGYIILPHNDPDRSWGTLIKDIDPLPYYAQPLKNIRLSCDFIDLKDGDGRNTELYKHFLNLQDYAQELTLEEKVNSIKIINKFILKDPIDESELMSTILRDDVVNREPSQQDVSISTSKRGSRLERIASKFYEENRCICLGGDLYLYDGKFYKRRALTEVERFLHETYDKTLTSAERREIIEFIKLKSFCKTEDVNKKWNEIVLKNGILNLSDLSLREHSPEELNTIYINYNWNDKPAYSPLIDSFMNQVAGNDEHKKQLLYEVIGYCMVQKPVFSKMFILFGGGGTGKSTFLNIIQKLISEEYVSTLTLHDLEKDFMPAELFGKLVNVGDDIDAKILKDTGMLKSLISGEKITAQRKFQDPFNFRNFSKLIFTCNRLPIINDRTSGIYRRICIIEVNNKIKKFDPFFMLKLEDSDMEYLLYKSIQAVRIALSNNALSETDDMFRQLEGFMLEQSTVLQFCSDTNLDDTVLNLAPVQDVYDLYVQYCERNRYKALNRLNFATELCSSKNYEIVKTTKGGTNSCRRFRKII